MDHIDVFLEGFFGRLSEGGEVSPTLRFLVAYQSILEKNPNQLGCRYPSPVETQTFHDLLEEMRVYSHQDPLYKEAELNLEEVQERLRQGAGMLAAGEKPPKWLDITKENKEVFAMAILADTFHRFSGVRDQFFRIRDGIQREVEQIYKEEGEYPSFDRRSVWHENIAETFIHGFLLLIDGKSPSLNFKDEGGNSYDETEINAFIGGALLGRNAVGDIADKLSQRTAFCLLNQLEFTSLKEREYLDNLVVDSRVNQGETVEMYECVSRIIENNAQSRTEEVEGNTKNGDKFSARIPANYSDLLIENEFDETVYFVQVALSNFIQRRISSSGEPKDQIVDNNVNWYDLRDKLNFEIYLGGKTKDTAVKEVSQLLRDSVVNLWRVGPPRLEDAAEMVAKAFFEEGRGESNSSAKKGSIIFFPGKTFEEKVQKAKSGLKEQVRTY